MTQPTFPRATILTEDVTVTCVPSFASWRAHAEFDPTGYGDESISQFNAAGDKRFRLLIPAGTPVQCDVQCDTPDVYCYTVVLPGHELASDQHSFGIVLRKASHLKLWRAMFKSFQAEISEE